MLQVHKKRLQSAVLTFDAKLIKRSIHALWNRITSSIFLIILNLLLGCSTMTVQSEGQPMNVAGRWVLLPVQNYSQQPQAGERMEAILATLVRNRGINNLELYPSLQNPDGLPALDDRQRYGTSLEWARRQGFNYGITGSIEEWHYKSGVEGEPAVGLSIQIVEVPSGRVLWSASGARSGWGRATVSGTAQQLLQELLSQLELSTVPS